MLCLEYTSYRNWMSKSLWWYNCWNKEIFISQSEILLKPNIIQKVYNQ